MSTNLRIFKLFFIILICIGICSCSSGGSAPKIDNSAVKSDGALNEKTGLNENDAGSDAEHHKDNFSDNITDSNNANNKPESQANTAYNDLLISNSALSDGKTSYAFHIYGENISYVSNTEVLKSASVIKLFIAQYAFFLVESGELKMDSIIGQTPLSALLEKMITISDNNSTNILIDYFEMEKLNSFFSENGYSGTSIGRKMLDFKAQADGKDNYTTAADVLKLLDNLYYNKDKFPQKDMLEIMKRQTVSTKIRRDLPYGTVIANKTGELTDVENDAGIIFSPNGDFALVMLTNNMTSPVNSRNMIAKSALDIYNLLNTN